MRTSTHARARTHTRTRARAQGTSWRGVVEVLHHSIFFATVEHHFGVAETLLLELMH